MDPSTLIVLGILGALVYYSGALDGLFAGAGSTSYDGMTSNAVTAMAQAIARQEGFNVSGSLPQRSNNPGSITDKSTGQLIVYPTAAAGWSALYDQVHGMLYGGSSNYTPDMTLQQAGIIYSGGDPNWSTNVASILGIPETTTLNQIGGGS